MKRKLKRILLIDDDTDCNFFQSRVLKKLNCVEQIDVVLNGQEALDFLTNKTDAGYPKPEIIFLDVNMPIMDGWEFLSAYENLTEEQKADIILIMLTTSLNPDDQSRALSSEDVSNFITKYLTEEKMMTILEEHFPDIL